VHAVESLDANAHLQGVVGVINSADDGLSAPYALNPQP